jgi:hypothetical protein
MSAKALQEVLGLLSIGATTAAAIASGDVAEGATVALSLITIAQKAIAAHEAVTGKPIDPSLLKPYQPIP